jgi:hypothetical protein
VIVSVGLDPIDGMQQVNEAFVLIHGDRLHLSGVDILKDVATTGTQDVTGTGLRSN